MLPACKLPKTHFRFDGAHIVKHLLTLQWSCSRFNKTICQRIVIVSAADLLLQITARGDGENLELIFYIFSV